MNNNLLNYGIITGANSQHWQCLGALAIGAHKNNVGFAIADHGLENWQKEELERVGVLWINHEFPDLSLDKGGGPDSLTIKTWLKPWICKASPFDKTVWIDSDAVVVGDITPIFNIDLSVGKKVLWSRKGELGQPIKIANILFGKKCHTFLPLVKYVNAGVIGFSKNEKFIDEWIDISKKILVNKEYIKLCFAKDQDALILTILQRMINGEKIPIILDDCYDFPADGYRNGKYLLRKQVSKIPKIFLEETIIRHPNQKIIHWVGYPKPWHLTEGKIDQKTIEDKKELIDIIIPLGTGSRYNNIEVRMAIRSIEKYIKGYRKIIIIGPDIPKFLKENEKLQLVKKREDKSNKQARVQTKIEWAFKNLDITEKCAYWNDDFLVLQPFDIRNMPYYTRGDLPLNRQNSGWKECKRRTALLLKSKNLPILNYDIHVPIIFEKTKHLSISDAWYKRSSETVLMRSYYGNNFVKENTISLRDIKLQHAWSGAIRNILKSKRWVISYGDGALRTGFGDWMYNFFLDKSSCEIDKIEEESCCNKNITNRLKTKNTINKRKFIKNRKENNKIISIWKEAHKQRIK